MTPGVQRIREPEVAVPTVGTPYLQRRWYTHAYNRLAFYRLIAVCSPWLPRPVQLRMARAVAMVVYRWMPREYAVVQGNLTHILPDASREDIARRARQVFSNFACCFVDLLGLNRRALPLQQAYVTEVHGLPHLQAELQAPRGFVAATAHLGNWELAGRLLSTYGRHIHVLMAPEQDPAIQRFLQAGRREADIRFVTNDRSAVLVQLLMALRRGDIVAVQMDRAMGHRSDVVVPFFGTPAVLPLGPLLLARAAQVPVLPCFCVMRPDARYEIWVDQAIPVAPGHEAAALQHLVGVLERYIAMAPNQWYNFYDIWDATPTTG
jgi:KDO2-lipid IV(A) lauroyltransferase